MNILIITAHPEPHSFTSNLAATTTAVFETLGAEVTCVDLYRENFDPVEAARYYPDKPDERFDALREQRHHWNTRNLPSDVNHHIRLLTQADVLILHFPLWWFGMPAMLKGWMDRVFVYGGVYDSKHRHEQGVMKNKRALMVVTAGASENACSYNGRDGDMQLMLWPAMHALHYIGFNIAEPFLIHGVRGGLDNDEESVVGQQITHKLDQLKYKLQKFDQWPDLKFNTQNDFTEDMLLKPDAEEYSPFVRHHRQRWLSRDGS